MKAINKIGFKTNGGGKAKSGKGTAKSGKSLGFKGGKGKAPVKTVAPVVKMTEPIDTERSDKMSIVFFDTKTLNAITKMCLPFAKGSEFQIHYRALTVHIEKNDFEVMFSIPTTFYNFDQEVSSGSVDYELDDIDNEAEKVKPTSDEIVQKLLADLPFFTALEELGFKVSLKEGNSGSIHRHPGRFGFSTVDLGKDPESPGVIYRHKVANSLHTDSVMYIDKSHCEIYTTEARIVNIEGAEDGGVKGDYCQIPTMSIIRPEESTEPEADLASSVLGEVDVDIFSSFHFVGAFGAEIKKYPMLGIILNMLKDLEYNPCIKNVVPKRITQRSWGVSAGSFYSGKKSGRGHQNYYDDYMYGDMYEGFGYYGGVDDFSYRDKKVGSADVILADSELENHLWRDPSDVVEQMIMAYGIVPTEEDVSEIVEILTTTFSFREQVAIVEYSDFHFIPSPNPVKISDEIPDAWQGW